MTNDPYKTLGLSPGATEEEIKAAYRELVKKYHPDKYQNNPLADLAQEKLQEVNEAYDYLMKSGAGRASGASGGFSSRGYSSGSYQSGSGYSGSSYANADYAAIRAAINSGQLARADEMLIQHPTRDAEWFFLSGILSYRKGYFDDGLSNVRQAMSMDPNNQEYRQVYSQMTGSGMQYRNLSGNRGYNNQDACMQCIECYCCSSLISPCW